jgi:hypothetical protein
MADDLGKGSLGRARTATDLPSEEEGLNSNDQSGQVAGFGGPRQGQGRGTGVEGGGGGGVGWGGVPAAQSPEEREGEGAGSLMFVPICL